MSLYNGPPRPGARGGRDQFSWENVKADKDREYYLGHSVKALAGRWQKGKDVYWYTREKGAGDAIQDEIQAVKQREEELMMEALGLKPKTVAKPAPQLDKHDIDELIKGKKDDEGQPDGAEAEEADRIKGLGYVAGTGGGLAEAVHTTLPGMGPGGGVGVQARPPPQQPSAGAAGAAVPATAGRPSAAVALATGMTTAQLKELRRAEKRTKKEAKKEAKKAKKAAKKAKKEAKHARQDAKEPQQHEAGIANRKRRHKRSASGSSSSSSSDSSGSDSDGGDGGRGRRQSGAEPAPRGERHVGGHARPAIRSKGGLETAAGERHWSADGGRRDAADRGPHLLHGRHQRDGVEARGRERDRDGDRERTWTHGREREREQERGDLRAGHRHGYTGEGPGRYRNGAGPDEDDVGHQHRGHVRHDSPRAPPRDAAGPPAAGQQRRQRHDSPDPGWDTRRSRSRSPEGRRRRAETGAGVRGSSRSRSRSPVQRRQRSRSPGPPNRGGRGHGRRRSPVVQGRNRGERGGEREAAAGDIRRGQRHDHSRSPSSDRGGGRGR